MTDLEQRLTEHLQRKAAAATPRYDLEAIEEGLSVVSLVDLDHHGRRRPRTLVIVGVAAALALFAALAIVAGTRGRDDSPRVTQPDAVITQDVMDLPNFSDLEPGTYSIDPDGDPATPLRVTYEVAADGWLQWIGAVKEADDGHVAVSITTVSNLVRDPCDDHRPAEPPVGPTVNDLATALSGLAPFELSSPPSDVTILGYHGTHLELTVPDLPLVGQGEFREFLGCTRGELRSWIATNLGDAFFGYNAEPGRTEEFWILDVDGTRLVLETNRSPASPPQDVAEMQAIFDSIRIDP